MSESEQEQGGGGGRGGGGELGLIDWRVDSIRLSVSVLCFVVGWGSVALYSLLHSQLFFHSHSLSLVPENQLYCDLIFSISITSRPLSTLQITPTLYLNIFLPHLSSSRTTHTHKDHTISLTPISSKPKCPKTHLELSSLPQLSIHQTHHQRIPQKDQVRLEQQLTKSPKHPLKPFLIRRDHLVATLKSLATTMREEEEEQETNLRRRRRLIITFETTPTAPNRSRRSLNILRRSLLILLSRGTPRICHHRSRTT